MTVFVGVDPGASGATCVRYGNVFVFVRHDLTDDDILSKLGEALADAAELKHRGVFAMIERVGAMPKQGVSSTFKFGVQAGKMQMAMASIHAPREYVAPAVWQRALSCLSKGDKNVTKRKAQELFPSLAGVITHRTADALLIAEYARRVFVSRGQQEETAANV